MLYSSGSSEPSLRRALRKVVAEGLVRKVRGKREHYALAASRPADDAGVGVKVGASVRRRFVGYGVFDGRVVALDAAHASVIVEWSDSTRTRMRVEDAARCKIRAESSTAPRTANGAAIVAATTSAAAVAHAPVAAGNNNPAAGPPPPPGGAASSPSGEGIRAFFGRARRTPSSAPETPGDVARALARVEAGGVVATLLARAERQLGWVPSRTRAVVKAYAQFMYVKARCGDWEAERLAPPALVDEIWHLDVLDTKRYATACLRAFGRVIHHDPDDDDVDDAARETRRDAARRVVRTTFGDEYDVDIWGDDDALASREPRREQSSPRAAAPRTPVARTPPRAETPAAARSMTICVRPFTGKEETFFRLHTTTKLYKLFDAYANRKRILSTMVRYFWKGKLLSPNETPADVGMEDGNCEIRCIELEGY